MVVIARPQAEAIYPPSEARNIRGRLLRTLRILARTIGKSLNDDTRNDDTMNDD